MLFVYRIILVVRLLIYTVTTEIFFYVAYFISELRVVL